MNTFYRLLRTTLPVLFLFVLYACQKQQTVTPPPESDITTQVSKNASDQLAASMQNWNRQLSTKATMKSYRYHSTISNEQQRQELLSSITAGNAIVAYGNVLDLNTLGVSSFQEAAALQPDKDASIAAYRSLATDQLHIGDKVVLINWERNNTPFTTFCIVNEQGIAWDNMLTGVYVVKDKPEETFTSALDGTPTRATAAYAPWYSHHAWWDVDWIWGSRRGRTEYTITIYCRSTGAVYSTDRSDNAYINIGSAQSESKVLVNSGSYGKIQYALGVATPLATVNFNSSNFTVSVSGIGSNDIHNGTKTLSPWPV
jgi:hypothetical protein